MLALISFLIIILLSLIVVKIGAIALESTGLSKDISQFQAQSAFSGIGFTTNEAETIMVNPLRRRIIRLLMLIGSAGLTTSIATLVLTFMNQHDDVFIMGQKFNSAFFSISVILLFLLFFFMISRTKFFDSFIKFIMNKPLHLIKKRSMLYDYDRVLGLSKGHSVVTFEIPKHHWMVNKTIGQLEVEKEGLMILGVYRMMHGVEEYIGLPSKDFKVHNKDKIIAYGKEYAISNLAKREKGKKGSIERKEAEQIHKRYEEIKKLHEDKVSS